MSLNMKMDDLLNFLSSAHFTLFIPADVKAEMFTARRAPCTYQQVGGSIPADMLNPLRIQGAATGCTGNFLKGLNEVNQLLLLFTDHSDK